MKDDVEGGGWVRDKKEDPKGMGKSYWMRKSKI